jgi:uncharacterized membrane protein
VIASLALLSAAACAQNSLIQIWTPPAGARSTAILGLSADGSYAVGALDQSVETAAAFTRPGPITLLPRRTEWIRSWALATSGDGTVTIGNSLVVGGAAPIWRWDRGSADVEVLTVPSGCLAGSATDLSDDGSVITGYCWSADSTSAWRWTRSTGMQPIPAPAGTASPSALAISGDGTAVLGQTQSGGRSVPFIWRQQTGSILMPPSPDGRDVLVTSLSFDGSVVCGSLYTEGAEPQAMRWSAQLGYQSLPYIPGQAASHYANAISGDGGTIVGYNGGQAFIWNELKGTRLLKTALLDQGVDLNNWSPYDATGISFDGAWIAGQAISDLNSNWIYGFIARLEEPCIGDFNRDGGVDGGDIASFFIAWEAAEFDADLDRNGGIDGSDIETFFVAWESGC